MTPARRFGLAHLATPLLAALPCLHTQMGDTKNVFSLYSILTQSVASPYARLLVPWVIFVLCTGIGASFALRRAASPRARTVAITTTVAGLLVFLDQSVPILKGYTQATFPFLPPITFRAGVGLWLILVVQFVALRLAWRIPRETTGSVH